MDDSPGSAGIRAGDVGDAKRQANYNKYPRIVKERVGSELRLLNIISRLRRNPPPFLPGAKPARLAKIPASTAATANIAPVDS